MKFSLLVMFQYSFVCMYLVFSLTSLLDLSSQVVLLSGVTHRVSQLAEHLLQLQTEWDTSSLQVILFIIESYIRNALEKRFYHVCLWLWQVCYLSTPYLYGLAFLLLSNHYVLFIYLAPSPCRHTCESFYAKRECLLKTTLSPHIHLPGAHQFIHSIIHPTFLPPLPPYSFQPYHLFLPLTPLFSWFSLDSC